VAIKSRCTERSNEVQSVPVLWRLIPNRATGKILIFGIVKAMNITLIFLIKWLMALKQATTWYGMEGRSVWHECVERINGRSVWGNIPSLDYKE